MTKNNMTIADKTAALNDMVAWFDSDEFELEKALDRFAEAEKLAGQIEADLTALKNTITVAKMTFDEVS
ncbi:MAG: hypothetical protein ABIR91_00270 [Candidatus Saccharimonadales bacterium]